MYSKITLLTRGGDIVSFPLLETAIEEQILMRFLNSENSPTLVLAAHDESEGEGTHQGKKPRT